MRTNFNKKAQSASSAAAFIAIMTVLIVLYILFLPPDIRNEILNDGTATSEIDGTDVTSNANQVALLEENVGVIDYLNTNEKTYDLPTLRISSPTSAQLLKAIPSLITKSAFLDNTKSTYELNFTINKATTKNLLLSFNVKKASGPLIIKLNEKEIFNDEIIIGNAKPLKLDQEYLADRNTLTITSPSVGLLFWKVYQYSLENLQITADVTDKSSSKAAQTFTISKAEKNNLDTVILYFYPGCAIDDVSNLQIELNDRTIYDSVADCGTRTFAALNKNYIVEGDNELKFSTKKGSYLLDNLEVKVKLNKPAYRTYFFDMDQDYFESEAARAQCGKDDGICPAGCADTTDADCCYRSGGFWCAMSTTNSNDRCVFYVDARDCTRCPTGYHDKNGDSPDNCEGTCGDNKDDTCPRSCLADYDEDCCYSANEENFFCKEVPSTGINDRCRTGISGQLCLMCPSGFKDEGGSSPDSCSSITSYDELEDVLINDYETKLIVLFTDDLNRKRVDINVNGHIVSIDTVDIEYTKVINSYVRKGSNSIEIIPKEDITIAEMRVEIKEI